LKTGKTIPNNKRHTIYRKNENEKCLLIEIEISGNINVIKKEVEDTLK
jgi:hypothetical protein